MTPESRSFFSLLLAGWLSLAATGCGTSPTPTASSPKETKASTPESVPPDRGTTAPDDAPPSHPVVAEEYWEVYFIEGTKVGHGHTTVEPVFEDQTPLVRITSHSSLEMKRFGQAVAQQIKLMSVETPDGQLVRFVSERTQPPVKMITRGFVKNNKLVLETSSLGNTQEQELAWNQEDGGLFADQRSLRRQPMKPGESRQIRALIPLFNQPGTISLTAKDHEMAELLEGEARLLRIDSKLDLAGNSMQTTLWVDEHGSPQKIETALSGLKQVTFRTDRTTAMADDDTGSFDLGDRSVVRVDRPIENPHSTLQIVYQARLADANPANVFVSDGTQVVETIDERTARITVMARRPGGDGGAQDAPTAADLAANNLIQKDDPRIQELSREVAAEDSDPWTVATSLEQFVHKNVSTKSFSQALASAADVARSLEGDCTEHAVLLAALCRARQIPARVAIGLVYFPRAQAFAYHMWNEVWIDDQWIPLDSTLAHGGIGAAHLKTNTSNLEGATALTALLPVLDLLGKLELEIQEIREP